MTNNFDPNQKRGGPANAGNWTKYENSDPEGALPDEPLTFPLDGGEIRVTHISEGVYRVEGVDDLYQQDFFVFNNPTPQALRKHATTVYDLTVLGVLEHKRDTQEAPTPALLAEIDRLRQRLEGRTEWDDLPRDSERYFGRNEIGDDTLDQLEVRRDENGSLSATAAVYTSMLEVYPELDEDHAGEELAKRSGAIEDWLRNTYKAVDGGSEWENASLEFTVTSDDVEPDELFPGDLQNVVERLQAQTAIVELHNDLNGGYRPGRMYGFHDSLRKHLDELDEAAE